MSGTLHTLGYGEAIVILEERRAYLLERIDRRPRSRSGYDLREASALELAIASLQRAWLLDHRTTNDLANGGEIVREQ